MSSALDALEHVFLGIVKDVLKMKVLSVDDFDALNADLEKVKKDLEAMTTAKNDAEANASKLSGVEEQKATCDKAVTGLSQERDTLKASAEESSKKLADLEVKVGGLESELATAKAAAATAAAAAPAETTAEDGEKEGEGAEEKAEGARLLRRR